MTTRPVDEGRILAVQCAQHADDAEATRCLNEWCFAAYSDDVNAYRACVIAGDAETRRQEFLAEGRPRIGATPEIVGMGTVRVFSDPTGNHRPVVDIASLRQGGSLAELVAAAAMVGRDDARCRTAAQSDCGAPLSSETSRGDHERIENRTTSGNEEGCMTSTRTAFQISTKNGIDP